MSKKKVVFITGGTSGIGACLVEQYLILGYSVHTCGRTPSHIQLLKDKYQQYQQHLSICRVDIMDKQQILNWLEKGVTQWQRIDILVLNAGISMRALFADSSPSVSEQIMQVNFMANLPLVHAALPFLKQTKGSLVGISSIASMIGLPGRSAYGASKAALHGWLDSLRKELKYDGVHVLIFSPGFVESDIRKKALTEQGEPAHNDGKAGRRIMSSSTCARKIIQAIHQKKTSVTLWSFSSLIACFLNRILPRVADQIIIPAYIQDRQLIQ